MQISFGAGMCKAAYMTDWALDYVRHVLKETGWSPAELARRVGVSHSTINRPLNTPDWPHALSRRTLAGIAKASGLDPAPFADAAGDKDYALTVLPDRVADISAEMIPLYDVAASAGSGSNVEYEPIIDQLAFPRDYLRKITKSNPRNLAIISVKGDSMEPTLRDDDVVMLDTSKTSLDYDGMFVIRSGEALLVKRVMRSTRLGYITVISDNRDIYPPQEHVADQVSVIGKVLWYGRRV